MIADEGVVIERDVAFVQGIFGIGGETVGPVVMACESPEQELTPERITDEMAGAVVVGGGRMTGEAVKRAIEAGCRAVVSGGLADADAVVVVPEDVTALDAGARVSVLPLDTGLDGGAS